MTPQAYEEFVENVVRQLDFGADTLIMRNTRFPGVRQPGHYEIDVSVRFKLAGKIDLFLIVECKNWARPVDRPVVQSLAQTRDAIGAHKAAIASPTGFSAEAMQVADVHGIALWVLSEATWSIPLGLNHPDEEHATAVAERLAFLGSVGIAAARCETPNVLIAFEDASPGIGIGTGYTHECLEGAAGIEADNIAGIDPRTACAQLADQCGRMLGIPVAPACRS
ncbi:restriction endonuclease [Caballeronia novacaledonica]|uniref:Restriction endonuclease type IV Mrr domain-containing protein n=1 Tax=Caballeronia novacaledonica TaxID=1544861 RepID=A0AA37ID53_9BURK|nr:restriction endonuclease [Caballeronia novacaledonica]GJH26977.1 hypothetical protein CBA19CS42_20695 [Caballeronia novacaledonica]